MRCSKFDGYMANSTFINRLRNWDFSSFITGLIEYETPKVVKVHNTGIGLLRRGLQLAIVLYVGLYQLWYARGYQEFAGIESSVTTKVKGYSISSLGELRGVGEGVKRRYERVWDEADYVVPPAENGAFFVTTNVVITPNQTWGECPEDPREMPESVCRVENSSDNTSSDCARDRSLIKSHGPQTGRCVPSDKVANVTVCEISSWCPVEDDKLPLGKNRPLITGSEEHTAFIKNSIRFSYFGDKFHRNNMPRGVCVYNFSDPNTHLCPIFKLGDIVGAAGGNYTKMSIKGGVVAIHISWICNLDFDFMKYCLPKYNFRLLDTYGWNFRHAHFHEEGRRTLYKAYGVKFVIIVQGRAGKFDLKNTVINIVAGLGLLSFITMFCDFILLHYVEERKIVKEKKFEILDRNQVLAGLINIMAVTNVSENKIGKQSSECLIKSKLDKESQWEKESLLERNGTARHDNGDLLRGRHDSGDLLNSRHDNGDLLRNRQDTGDLIIGRHDNGNLANGRHHDLGYHTNLGMTASSSGRRDSDDDEDEEETWHIQEKEVRSQDPDLQLTRIRIENLGNCHCVDNKKERKSNKVGQRPSKTRGSSGGGIDVEEQPPSTLLDNAANRQHQVLLDTKQGQLFLNGWSRHLLANSDIKMHVVSQV